MVLIAQEFHEHFWQILRTATKFDKIFHFKFDVTEQCQIFSGRFFSNFVAFSEYPDFNKH